MIILCHDGYPIVMSHVSPHKLIFLIKCLNVSIFDHTMLASLCTCAALLSIGLVLTLSVFPCRCSEAGDNVYLDAGVKL